MVCLPVTIDRLFFNWNRCISSSTLGPRNTQQRSRELHVQHYEVVDSQTNACRPGYRCDTLDLRGARAQVAAADVKPPRLLSGRDLIAMGFDPGPRLGETLRLLETAQLEGEVTTRDEAVAWVRRL